MKVFQMKTKPHGHERLEEFLDEGFICIGWPGIGDLSNVDKDEIRKRLQNVFDYTGHTLGYNLGQVNAFSNTMENGDIVLIKEGEDIHVGIVDDYEYQKKFDNDNDGACHRRKVKWKERIGINDLKDEVQRFVNNRHTISQFPGNIEAESFENLNLKKNDINKNEKNRLDNLFSEALNILESELSSEDPERRLKAASELIRLKTRGGNNDG
jgi:predicted Mrr-cat superfamily restriction endonuclease